MTEEQAEAGEMTERFRAFSQTVDPEPSRALPFVLIGVAAVAVVTVVVVLIAAFA